MINKTPASGSLSLNSEGTTGATAPTTALEVGGVDGSGNLQSLGVNSSGAIVLPQGAATSAKQDAEATLVGAVDETAPVSDTASSGLNGRLQRVAQRITSLIALLPAALGQTTKSASLAVTVASDDDLQGKLGSLTETAPATDTASSGLNGRLQRIAQRLTTLLAVFPTTIDTNSGSKSASTLRVVLATDQPQLTNKLLVTPDANSTVNVAQINGVTPLMGAGNTGTGSPRVTIASDQAAIPVSQSGTWTVQPGNTANTTAWLTTAAGKTAVDKVRKDYSGGSVTTAAYTQLIASLAAACTEIEIFDSSGQTLVLATGAAASEVDQIYIFPGGNGRVPLAIAASTRVAVKAVSATASTGELTINFYA